MNTNTSYVRGPGPSLDPSLDPSRDPAPEAARPAAEVSPLALHKDPSLADQAPQPDARRPERSVQWVRPSELPTLIGGRYVRKGADVQSQLARRSRRASVTAASRARDRISRSAIGQSDALNRSEGGIGL